jgi:putative SOS response-associated peptidase YedK
MCGRFAFFSPREAIVQFFGVAFAGEISPHYNISPTQLVPAVRVAAQRRRLDLLYWGLIPHWAKDKKMASRTINARAETLVEKPSFRSAFKRRRCLILADGYYEWQAREGGKQPYFLHRADRQPFAMAGLWESWRDPAAAAPPDSAPLESCTIITTGAAESIRAIHDRMPAILTPENYDLWLDPAIEDNSRLQPLLLTPSHDIEATAVSRRVNSPRNDGPELLTRVDSQ